MSHVSRSDIYARDEKGPEWFDEFLYSLSVSPVQDILSAINDKRGETVKGVVQAYREKVGLDIVQLDDDDDENIKQASMLSCRCPSDLEPTPFIPLSIRHATKQESIVEKIKSNPELVSAIESLCRHSGGTKKIQSLISFLRERIGNEVSFSDDGLVQYLQEFKDKFQENLVPETRDEQVGLVGTTDDSLSDHDDDIAEYMRHGGGTK